MKKDFLSLLKTAASVTFIPCLTQFPIAHIPITQIFEVVQTIIAQCEKKGQKTNLFQILLCQEPNLHHLPRVEELQEL